MTEDKAAGEAALGSAVKIAARSVFARLEVDTRLLGLILAIAILWVAFSLLSNGDFLTARNLWNLSVQSAAIAIMTTGMVLIIVSRNIDLSIGSILVFAALVMGLFQAEWMPGLLGPNFDRSFLWVAILAVGIAGRGLIGVLYVVLIVHIWL